jgi:diguanylate cyclase (GGDEF)-like protein
MGVSQPGSLVSGTQRTWRPTSIVGLACVLYVALVGALAISGPSRRAIIAAGATALSAVVVASVTASIHRQTDESLWLGLSLASIFRAAAAASIATGVVMESVDSDFRSFALGCCLGGAIVLSIFLAPMLWGQKSKSDTVILSFDISLFALAGAVAIALPIALVGRTPYATDVQINVAIAAVAADGLALGLLTMILLPRTGNSQAAAWLLGGWTFSLIADWESDLALVAKGIDRSEIFLVSASAAFALGLGAVFRLVTSRAVVTDYQPTESKVASSPQRVYGQLAVGVSALGFAVVIGIEGIWRGQDHLSLLIALSGIGLALAICRLTLSSHSQRSSITQLETKQAELERQALSDSVTELPNHRALITRLTEEVERARRFKQPLSVCFVDVDAFKQINDTHGHQIGDDVLREIGSMLRANARQIDIVGRYGGEEFVILLPGTWTDDALIFGERLREAIAITTIRPQPDVDVRLSVSVGVAGLPEHASDRDSLLKRADDAVYVAKRSGRNQVHLFNPDIATESGRMLTATEATRLVQVIEERQPYSAGHGERVGQYAATIAQRLGLDGNEVERFFQAGRLHDLGKISVPDSILAKESALAARETEIIRNHPVVGARLLESNPTLVPLASAVRHHHERWDGSGYPYRLSGEFIPLASRIIAIAEAYDAMVTDSPWRSALDLDGAMGELAAGADKQFDPKLVELFSRVVESAAV